MAGGATFLKARRRFNITQTTIKQILKLDPLNNELSPDDLKDIALDHLDEKGKVNLIRYLRMIELNSQQKRVCRRRAWHVKKGRMSGGDAEGNDKAEHGEWEESGEQDMEEEDADEDLEL